MGIGASLQLGRLILDFGRHRRRTGAQAHVSSGEDRKTYASDPLARPAPVIHGFQLWLCYGRSSVRFGSFVSFGGADVPSLSAALSGGRNDFLAA